MNRETLKNLLTELDIAVRTREMGERRRHWADEVERIENSILDAFGLLTIRCCWCGHETPLDQEREALIAAMSAHMLECTKSPLATALKACEAAYSIIVNFSIGLQRQGMTCPPVIADALDRLRVVLGVKVD